jgi:protein transport protein SEC61 subunit gamma-like protein
MQIKLKEKLEEYKRVLVVAKKPSFEDFKYSAKISAIGTALVGLIGLLIYLISILLIG